MHEPKIDMHTGEECPICHNEKIFAHMLEHPFTYEEPEEITI